MSTNNPLPFSNQFERGHSFNWAGEGTEGRYYFNDCYVTDFIRFENAILICRKSHKSNIELKPELIYENGYPISVNSPYGELGWAVGFDGPSEFVTLEEYNSLDERGEIREGVIYYIYED